MHAEQPAEDAMPPLPAHYNPLPHVPRVEAGFDFSRPHIFVTREYLTQPHLDGEYLARLEGRTEEEKADYEVALADYPQLRDTFWSTAGIRSVSRSRAFAQYEAQWEYISPPELSIREREFIRELAVDFGGGFILD